MKKRYKILIAVLLILFAISTFLTVKYWSLIKVVWNGFTLSPETLKSMRDDNDKKTVEIVEKLGVQTIKPLTEEEEKELASGNISKQDAINIVLGNTTMEEIKQSGNDKNADTSQQTTSNNSDKNNGMQDKNSEKPGQNLSEDEVNEKISNLIGEIYVLKSHFTTQLKNVEAWVLQQHRGLSKEEKAPKQSPAEQEIGRQMLSKVSKLESECDSKMNAILQELKTLLKKTGRDISIVTQINDAYENEKQITKSYYISTYR